MKTRSTTRISTNIPAAMRPPISLAFRFWGAVVPDVIDVLDALDVLGVLDVIVAVDVSEDDRLTLTDSVDAEVVVVASAPPVEVTSVAAVLATSPPVVVEEDEEVAGVVLVESVVVRTASAVR